MLTETVFAWPGLGFYITNSLLNADMNAVLGGTRGRGRLHRPEPAVRRAVPRARPAGALTPGTAMTSQRPKCWGRRRSLRTLCRPLEPARRARFRRLARPPATAALARCRLRDRRAERRGAGCGPARDGDRHRSVRSLSRARPGAAAGSSRALRAGRRPGPAARRSGRRCRRLPASRSTSCRTRRARCVRMRRRRAPADRPLRLGLCRRDAADAALLGCRRGARPGRAGARRGAVRCPLCRPDALATLLQEAGLEASEGRALEDSDSRACSAPRAACRRSRGGPPRRRARPPRRPRGSSASISSRPSRSTSASRARSRAEPSTSRSSCSTSREPGVVGAVAHQHLLEVGARRRRPAPRAAPRAGAAGAGRTGRAPRPGRRPTRPSAEAGTDAPPRNARDRPSAETCRARSTRSSSTSPPCSSTAAATAGPGA